MEYLVYKNEIEKNNIGIIFSKFNNQIYHEENIPKSVTNNYEIVSYYSIHETIHNLIEKNNDYKYDNGNDQYFKFYDLKPEVDMDHLYKIIADILLYYHSGTKDSVFLGTFFQGLNRKYYKELFGFESDSEFLDDMTDFALLAFSNSYDTNKNNDLLNSYLYDRDNIKTIFDKVMGNGAFDIFNEYCFMIEGDYTINNKNVSTYQFNKVMESLKKYFYKKMDMSDNIPLEEKNAMIIRFNEEYDKLVNKQKEYQSNKKSRL